MARTGIVVTVISFSTLSGAVLLYDYISRDFGGEKIWQTFTKKWTNMEKLRDLIKKKYRINRLRKYSQRAGGVHQQLW